MESREGRGPREPTGYAKEKIWALWEELREFEAEME